MIDAKAGGRGGLAAGRPLPVAAAILVYGVVVAALVGGGAWAAMFALSEPAARRAVLVSAGLAFAVQLVAFVVLRLARPGTALAAWAAGSLLRVVVLAVYALLVVRGAGLPPGPALLSFAAFVFVSMLVEPFVLNARL